MIDWAEVVCRTGGLMSPTELEELAYWAGHAPAGDMVQVGHYTGASTVAIAAGVLQYAPAATLHTIDNHGWRPCAETFADNVEHYHGEPSRLRVWNQDFRTAIPKIDGPIGFVFYDGNHADDDVDDFWRLIRPKLADRAFVLFDDADWAASRRLGRHAERAGFGNATRRLIVRHDLGYTTGDRQFDLDIAKRHPDTYTLEVFVR